MRYAEMMKRQLAVTESYYGIDTSMTDGDDDDVQYRADREAALMTTTISTAATM